MHKALALIALIALPALSALAEEDEAPGDVYIEQTDGGAVNARTGEYYPPWLKGRRPWLGQALAQKNAWRCAKSSWPVFAQYATVHNG